MASEDKLDGAGQGQGPQDIESYLAERQRLDKQFEEKFHKVLTVMFTDLKGSTALAETSGDLATRMVLKQYFDIVNRHLAANNGTLVKTIGDGTLSHFPTSQDGLRCAAGIQRDMDEFNMKKTVPVPIMVRIGLHTGKVIFEGTDIFGDVVNTASRFESTALPGEICFSEESFNALSDKDEIYCRYVRDTSLKGKKEPVRVYKAFWNKAEMDADIKGQTAGPAVVEEKGMSAAMKFTIAIIIPILLAFIILQIRNMQAKKVSKEDVRSISHTAGDKEPSGDGSK